MSILHPDYSLSRNSPRLLPRGKYRNSRGQLHRTDRDIENSIMKWTDAGKSTLSALSRRSFMRGVAGSAAAGACLALSRPKPGWAAACSPVLTFETELGGTITFPNNVVTVNVGDDIRQKMLDNFPTGGPGGVMYFKYGEHTGFVGTLATGGGPHRGNIAFISECGPANERTKINVLNAGQPATFIGVGLNFFATGLYIAIDGLELTGGFRMLNMEGPEGIIVNDCYMHHAANSHLFFGHLGGTSGVEGKDIFGWCEIRGGELSYNTGATHNAYMSGQKRYLADGVFSHSSQEHCLKFVTGRLEIRNCSLWTSDHDLAFLQQANLGDLEPNISAAPLDFAGSHSWIHDNFFKVYTRNPQNSDQKVKSGSGKNVVQNRRRKSIWGGEVLEGEPAPALAPWIDGIAYLACENWREVGGRDYWLEAAAAGGRDDVCSPFCWKHFFLDNIIEQMNPAQTSTAYLNQGSHPVFPTGDPDYAGACQDALDAIIAMYGFLPTGVPSSQLLLAPRPPGWFERNIVWATGNQYIGAGSHNTFNADTAGIDPEFEPHYVEVATLPPHPEF